MAVDFGPSHKDAGHRFQQLSKRLLTQVGLEAPARWLWDRRPSNRAQRKINASLNEADRLDNERMRLVLASVLGEDSNCIDIGASGGVFLREMIRVSPRGRHIAYEPLPADFDRLAKEFPNADVRNAAVSNVNGQSSFAYVSNSPGWSGFHEYDIPLADTQIETISVKTVVLDDDLPPDFGPTLIKIDVNGAEREVLEGAIRTLQNHRPVVLFEHGLAASAYGTTSAMIFELLQGQSGLRIFDLEGRGPFDAESFRQAAQLRWNFLARP